MNAQAQGVAWRLSLAGLFVFFLAAFLMAGQIDQPAHAQTGGLVPGNTQGQTADPEFWREIRKGARGTVSSQNPQAGQLIQSEGDNWRAMRNGPLVKWGGWALFGTIALLALFFFLRGRIAIEHGPSEERVTRFSDFERMSHWILAVSFIILAISGLNMLYGKYVLLPLIGGGAFAYITALGKWAHNFLAFGFMLGLVLIFFRWVKHNIPNLGDIKWLLVGGGLFTKGVHPPARKFNAGQKIIFWLVILCGLSISASGISLLFPFQTALVAKTFAALNAMGFTSVPVEVTPMMEMQYSQLWHSIVAVVFVAVILAHIYIGSIGMEGAFDAMGSGEVDVNWAKEHHSLWVEEMSTSGQLPGSKPVQPPAE